MKITKGYLQQVIKEETEKVLSEGVVAPTIQTNFKEGTHIKCPSCESVFKLSKEVETSDKVGIKPKQQTSGASENNFGSGGMTQDEINTYFGSTAYAR